MFVGNEIYKNIILQVANEKFKYIRKRYYSLSYYLNMFIFLQDDVVKWKSLQLLKAYKPKKEGNTNDKGYHYKIIKN